MPAGALVRSFKNLWGMWRFLLNNDVYFITGAGVPVNGVIGTGDGAAFAGKGSLYVDTTNGKHYVNSGTKASPVWSLITQVP